MSALRKVFHWFLVIVFFFCALGGFSGKMPGAGILFLVLMILMLPFEGLPWNKIAKGKRALKYLICLVLMLAGLAVMNQSQQAGHRTGSVTESQNAGDSDTSAGTSSGKTSDSENTSENAARSGNRSSDSVSLSEIPAYSGKPYTPVNNNRPFFQKDDLTTKTFEHYSRLDRLGRCGTAYANISEKTMPTEKRGYIGSVHPSGWHTIKYQGIEGRYLYNRCHLIGYQLSAENANERNLITGTRYLNTEGMLPFENMVADYVKETGNHVLYRVTPMFKGNNLLAEGVLMEAESVEDNGKGISYNVFCYNVQPGIKIDYTDGSSSVSS